MEGEGEVASSSLLPSIFRSLDPSVLHSRILSPDIHWHIGEDDEQETIATATSPRRSRRSWIAIVIIVMLGAGLGMAYR